MAHHKAALTRPRDAGKYTRRFRGLQDWEVDGFRALKDAGGIIADLPKHADNAGSVAHQRASFD